MGLGKVRHIELNQLWVQDRVSKGDTILAKVGTNTNLADALTKYVDRRALDWHMKNTKQKIEYNRHELMPHNDMYFYDEEEQ